MCARAEPISDHGPGCPGSIGTGLLPLGQAWSVPPPQGAEQSPLAPFRTEPQPWPLRQPLETSLGPQRVSSSGKQGSPSLLQAQPVWLPASPCGLLAWPHLSLVPRAPGRGLLWPGRASPSASQLLAFSPGKEQAAGERLRPGRCKQPRAGHRWFLAEQPRA